MYSAPESLGERSCASLPAETDGAPCGETGAPQQAIRISNQRLRLPLTKTAWNRLNALASRWSVAFSSNQPPPVAPDLEPPDNNEQAGSAQLNGILENLDENAFGQSR